MTKQKEIRTKINRAAHRLALVESVRISSELIARCDEMRKAGKSHEEIMQAIDGMLTTTHGRMYAR